MKPSRKKQANHSADDQGGMQRTVRGIGTRICSHLKHRVSPDQLCDDAHWLRSAFDATEDLLSIKTRQSIILWANKAFREYFGMTEEDFLSDDDAPRPDADTTAQCRQDDQLVLTNGDTIEIPSDGIQDRNGVVHYFQTIKSPITGPDGCITGLISVSRRIRPAEMVNTRPVAHQQQQVHLQRFVSNLPLAAALLDAKMQFIACSEAWTALFSPGINMDPSSSYSERLDKILRLRPAYEATLRSGETKNLRGMRIENGAGREEVINVSLEPWFLPSGAVGGAIVTVEEMTPEEKAVEALRHSEENLSITLNSLSQGVITTDADGRIQRMNPESESMTGWTIERAKNRPIDDVLRLFNTETNRPLDCPAKQVEHQMATVHFPDETGLIHHDGTRRNVAVSGTPLRNAFGKVFGQVFVVRDETEKRLRAEEFRQSQKMDSIGKLAGGVAHDFNNMLGGIMGAAELLEEELAERPKLLKYVNIIFRCSQQAADLTDKLLAFSRKEKPVFLSVSVHDCINKVLDIVERNIDPRITVKQQFNAKNDHIMGSDTQIQNTILNLCLNARDAMKEGGLLTVETDNVVLVERDTATTALGIPPGEYLRLRVKDTGSGITTDIKEHIFEPFFTTKASGKGTGLGLSAVYGIVKSHRGGVQAHSEPNIGSILEIFLPLTSTDDQHALEKNAQKFDAVGRILLIDDEAALREASAELIRRFGHEVLCAASGIQGMKIYHEQADTIDLILLDLVMPGKSGMDCLREIHAINPAAKVIICTGYATDETIIELQKEGIFRILHKPFRRTDLLAAIENALQLD